MKVVTKEPFETAVEPTIFYHGIGIFDGDWSNGTISGNKLTWTDGNIAEVIVDEVARTIQLAFRGSAYSGRLCVDGKIHWSDGDVWCRKGLQVVEQQPASVELHTDAAAKAQQPMIPASAPVNHSVADAPAEPVQVIKEAAFQSVVTEKEQTGSEQMTHAANETVGVGNGRCAQAGSPSQAKEKTSSSPRKERCMCCC